MFFGLPVDQLDRDLGRGQRHLLGHDPVGGRQGLFYRGKVYD